MYQQLIVNDRTRRIVLLVFVLISIMLVLFPYLIPVDVSGGEVLYQGVGRNH
jgi:hypothetical protein